MIFKVSAIILIAAVIAIIVAFISTIHSNVKTNSYNDIPRTSEREEKLVGNLGERIATNAIKRVLRDDDYLFTNVTLSYDDKETELDNVIVNKYGVFIIEVKYYKGILYGAEDDYEWKKYKNDGYGNIFEKKRKKSY